MSLQEALLLFLAFWLLISLIFTSFRVRGVEVKPFLLIAKVRPERVDQALSRLISRWGRALMLILDVGVALGFGMMAFSLYFLVINLVRHFTSPQAFIAVAPPIPGLMFPWEVAPHFLAALSIAVVVHELAHAVASRLVGVRIKSFGAALLAVILAAFVELEEGDLERAGLEGRLKIYAAGSFANLALFIILLLIFIVLFQPGGVLVHRVEPYTPAFNAGIVKDSVIKQLNETLVYGVSDLHKFMERTRPDQMLVVGFIAPDGSWRRVVLRTASHPANTSKGFLGVLPIDFYEMRFFSLPPSLLIHFHIFYSWLQVLLFSLAVFNMLPFVVADGGRMVHAVLNEFLKSNVVAKRVLILLTALSLILVASNIAVTLAH